MGRLATSCIVLLLIAACGPPPSAVRLPNAVTYKYHIYMMGPTYTHTVTVDPSGALTREDTAESPGTPKQIESASRQLSADEREKLTKALAALPQKDIEEAVRPDSDSAEVTYGGHRFVAAGHPKEPAELSNVFQLIEELSRNVTSGKLIPAATPMTHAINSHDDETIRKTLSQTRDPKEIAELTIALAEMCPSDHGQCMGVFLSPEEVRDFARNRSASISAVSARIDSGEPLSLGLLDLLYFLADDPAWRPQVLQWLDACHAHGQQFVGVNLVHCHTMILG